MQWAGQLLGAVEGGGSSFLCGVASEPGRWVARVEIPTRSPGETLADVNAFFAPYRARGLARLGVATFGPLDLVRGRTLTTPKAGWSHVPLIEALRGPEGLEVVLDTDVNAAALAEARWGAAVGDDPVVYITVGTGIGVGLWMHGRPVHGLLHPELGHLPAPALDEVPGLCPFHGRCIEGVAAVPALRARLGADPRDAPEDSPVWARQGEYLAHLVVAAVLCVSPMRVVMGGGVARRAALWPALRLGVSRYLHGYMPLPALSAEGIDDYLVPSALDPDAGLLGALALAMTT